MDRRDFVLALAAPLALAHVDAREQRVDTIPRKGRIAQGVTRGVFARGMALEDACREAAGLGIRGFDLIGPNSTVNHRDYMFDHMSWGVDVVKRVNSPRVKILYDIYHAQIMDGDVVRAIRENIGLINHFHTGGNPGRNDIDETQELNYRFIMQEIAALGFSGFVTHEYTPKPGSDPIAVLRNAIEICDV